MQISLPFIESVTLPERVVEAPGGLPWIETVSGVPYFQTDAGDPWMPIGQNDAITWPELRGLFRRKNSDAARTYFQLLASHGVTCVRLMLEYCQHRHRWIENPVGNFPASMVQLWDDIFALSRQTGVRVLLTPVDTFWMWIRWRDHPFNAANGGPCRDRRGLLLCPQTRQAIKNRLAFVVQRWGGCGSFFAWDLWNEIHPSYSYDTAEVFQEFIADLSGFVRNLEIELYGRAHPQTVSVFLPHMVLDSRIPEAIYRHSKLDFASTHFYEEGTIDDPRDTVAAALSTGRLMREALREVPDQRPFFDSEHGPIHTHKDKHKTLPEAFDDEYFRHMQWAHLAAGGAGGGMRWPNRRPHSLTLGMREAQRGMARFLPLMDWSRFRRRNWNEEIAIGNRAVRGVACGDQEQAVVWMIRKDQIDRSTGMLRKEAAPVKASVFLPELRNGNFRITSWDTYAGVAEREWMQVAEAGLRVETEIRTDQALAIRRV